MFNAQLIKQSAFWDVEHNQELLKQILNCDEIHINNNITQSDYHLGCDCVAKKKVTNGKGITYYISHIISLRIRYPSRYLDVNLRNNISNPKSELSKILAASETDSSFSKYHIQLFDVGDNNKAKFGIKWMSSDIADFAYQNLDALPSLYKHSTNRYDIPISQAVKYGARCYDLANDEVNKVNYQYIKNTYR